MFGPEHAAAAPEALTRATPTLGAFKLRLLAGFDQLSFPIIRRMRSILQPNIRRIPNNGVEDHGLVDFYEDHSWIIPCSRVTGYKAADGVEA